MQEVGGSIPPGSTITRPAECAGPLRDGARAAPQVFFENEAHQPCSFTSLPAKIWHAPQVLPDTPL